MIAIYALGCFRNFSCTPAVPKLPWRNPPLANGVKVVEKVITSKIRFLDSNICIGVFSQFQLHTCCTKITLKRPPLPPQPCETSERMNFNVIDIKQLTWKLFIYWYLMSFFHKKMSQKFWATIMPFGPVTNFLQALFYFNTFCTESSCFIFFYMLVSTTISM